MMVRIFAGFHLFWLNFFTDLDYLPKCLHVIKLQPQKNIAPKSVGAFSWMNLLQNVWRGWCLYNEICQQKEKHKSHAEAVANRSTLW